MENSQLQVILSEQNVAAENAKQLLVAFGAPFEEAGEILATYQTIKVTKEDDFATMAKARSQRLSLKNIRVEVEKKRKELKEDSLRVGKAIDSVARFVKETIEPAESYLEAQEKFAEIKAAERAAKVKAERIEELMQFTNDISMYNFESMDDEKFGTLVSSLKTQRDAEIAAAKKLEEDRIAAIEAEKKRQAEVEAENAKLRAEAEKREKEIAAERAKVQAETNKRLAQERAFAEEERQKREAIEAAQLKREQAEADSLKKAQEAERQALLAPDKEKLLKLANDLEAMQLPALQSKDARAVLEQVEGLLEKVTVYIRGNVKGL